MTDTCGSRPEITLSLSAWMWNLTEGREAPAQTGAGGARAAAWFGESHVQLLRAGWDVPLPFCSPVAWHQAVHFNPFTNRSQAAWRSSLASGHLQKHRVWVLQQRGEPGEALGLLSVPLESGSTAPLHGPDPVKCKAGRTHPSQTSQKPAGSGDFQKCQAWPISLTVPRSQVWKGLCGSPKENLT